MFCSNHCARKADWQKEDYRSILLTRLHEINSNPAVREKRHERMIGNKINNHGSWYHGESIIRYNNPVKIYRNINNGRFISKFFKNGVNGRFI